MTKPAIIVIISNYFPIVGGAERQAQLQAELLVRRGYAVTVLTAARGEADSSSEYLNGVSVIRFRYPHIRILGSLIYYFKVARYLLFSGPEVRVYHVHMVKNLAFIASLIGSLQKKNVVLKFTGWWELDVGVLNPKRRHTLANRLLFSGLKRANRYLCISSEILESAIAAGFDRKKIMFLPNGVDTAKYCRTSNDMRSGDEMLSVLFVGRLVKEKGLFVLLDAWRVFAMNNANARLEILGDGVLRRELENRCGELGIGSTVMFHGQSSTPQDYYRSADIYVLPSLHEGLSNTLLEAMAMGLPVVSTRISGTVDIIEHGVTGLLVEAGNSRELAYALERLSSSKNLREELGNTARKMIVDSFSIEHVVTQLESIYSSSRY